jgi:serpin B
MINRKFALICSLAALALTAGCESIGGPGSAQEPLKQLPRPLTSAEQGVIAGSNQFAFGLLREVDRADTSSNVFVSPLSASMALGMTMNGARGATLDEMRSTLGFGGMSLGDINSSYRSLIDLLRTLDGSVDMRIANSIWARQGFPFEPSFFATGKQFFDAEVATLDFASPSAPNTINAWVDRGTNGKIKKIVESIPGDAVMYLINAIYFKGTWKHQFDRRATQDASFTRADGTRQTVKMMHRNAPVRHYSDGRIEAVELLYGREAFSMTILLPRPGANLDSLVATLDETRWKQITEGFTDRKLDVYLPRFRLEYEKALNDPLKALGMNTPFSPGGADFTGMSPAGRDLFISNVKQKTYVDVNEEGTEAAAATSVEIRVVSLPSSFTVNRPFIVAIRERFSGTILFLGKITAPPSS